MRERLVSRFRSLRRPGALAATRCLSSSSTSVQVSRQYRSRFAALRHKYKPTARYISGSVPTPENLPGVPRQLLDSPGDLLKFRFRHVEDASFEYSMVQNKDGTCNAVAVISLPDHDPITAQAKERSLKQARDAAALRLLYQLHAAGLVDQLWPKPDKLDSLVMKREKDAIRDVYDHCAKHLTLPNLTAVKYKPLAAIPNTTLYKCTIHLEEQAITVEATAKQYAMAEASAAIKFKAAAEAHVVKWGTTQRLVVKDGSSLGVANARRFHLWLKENKQSYDYMVDVKRAKGWHEAQVYMWDEYSWKSIGPQIRVVSRKSAEQIALSWAAITMVKEDPSLRDAFEATLHGKKGRTLPKVTTVELGLSSSSLLVMEETIANARTKGLYTGNFLRTAGVESEWKRRATPQPLTAAQRYSLSTALREKYRHFLNATVMAPVRRLRSKLPINQYKKEVYSLVEDNVYSIIVGATGSGKTTQVPQIILEQYYQEGNGADCNIVCTQPRRIAATSVARRLADELGPIFKDRVGYHVRFDSRLPSRGGSVTYCTTGILLQQLQTEPGLVFDQVSHIIIDEVHERDAIIDFTLAILKKTVTERLACGKKVPRITFMSATLDTELFTGYFTNLEADGTSVKAPVLSVRGRTFPVSERHLDEILAELRESYSEQELEVVTDDGLSRQYIELEGRFVRDSAPENEEAATPQAVIDWVTKKTVNINDKGSSAEEALVPYGLVAATIAHVTKTTDDGAILVFLPGLEEMRRVEERMMAPILGVHLQDATKYRTYLLHSAIRDSQASVFDPIPHGVRKIILSTNIAESSITIPEVKHVIDVGKVREARYDHVKRITALQCTWISKANAKQRAGRAGRLQNGHYLALYSKERYQSMRATALSELLRSDLQTICLSIISSSRDADVRDFLASAIAPPNPASVHHATRALINLGALNPDEKLTALGRLLASLPIHPTLGKMIVLGLLFKCLDPILVIGVASEERGLFITSPGVDLDSKQHKQSFTGGTQSDHLTLYNAFTAVRQLYVEEGETAARKFAMDKNIQFESWEPIHGAAQQIEQILVDSGLISETESTALEDRGWFGGASLNVNSQKAHVIKAILLAGLVPNIAVRQGGSALWRMAELSKIILPSTSVVKPDLKHKDLSLATFTNLSTSADGATTFLRDASIIDPLTACLFAGHLAQQGDKTVVASDWLPFQIKSPQIGSVRSLLEFREAMDRVQTSAFADLAKGKPLHDNPLHEFVTGKIVELLDVAAGWKDE